MTPVVPMTMLVVFLYAAVKGFERPVIAIAFYFATSIINPHSYASFFYSIPMAKVAFGVAFLSMMINSDKINIFFPSAFWAMLLFTLMSNLSALTAYYPDLAEKRHGEFNKIALICFFTVWVVKNRKDYSILFYSVAFAFYLNVMKSMTETQTKNRWYEITGTGGWLGDSNDWSLALVMALPLFYGCVVLAKNWKERCFHALATLSGFMVIPLTSSRGGFLGAAVVAIVLLITEPKRIRALIACAGFGFTLFLYLPASFMDQFNSIFDAESSATSAWDADHDMHGGTDYTGAERVYNWKLAYKMALDNPITGVGWGNYVRMRARYEIHPGEHVCHSTWFQVLGEAGFGGLIGFVSMILVACYSLIRTWWKSRKTDPWKATHARVVIAGLVGFCLSASFVSREYSDLLYLFLCLAIILPRIPTPAASPPPAVKGTR